MVRHQARVWARAEDTVEGEALIWRVHCTCWAHLPVPDGFFRRAEAEAELAAHLRKVAPPRRRRCRAPSVHHRRWWEACSVCADQPVLAGMENLADQ